jgi:hypothetical protein
MKHDPVYLFENKPEKFQKFLRKRQNKQQDSDQDAPPTMQPVSTPPKNKITPAAPAFHKQVSAPV